MKIALSDNSSFFFALDILMVHDFNRREVLSWYYQGYNFYESSLILLKNESQLTVFPMLTLQAFSVECSLKSLLLLTVGKFPNSHNSLQLFELLPSALKVAMVNRFDAEFSKDLNDILLKVSTDFMDSRYFFQKQDLRGVFWASDLKLVAKFLLDYFKNYGEAIIRGIF